MRLRTESLRVTLLDFLECAAALPSRISIVTRGKGQHTLRTGQSTNLRALLFALLRLVTFHLYRRILGQVNLINGGEFI